MAMLDPVVGRHYAYRERAQTPGEPVRPVELVKVGPGRRTQVKVRWLDGEYEGLEEWVPRVRLVARWENAEQLLRDERGILEVADASEYVHNTPRMRAVQEVFFTLPDDWAWLEWGSADLLCIPDLDRFELDREALLAEPLHFIESDGAYWAPFQAAERLAQAICKRTPEMVLARIRKQEDELTRDITSGKYKPDAAQRWLEEQSAQWKIMRQWCGEKSLQHFDQVRTLETEIKRLQQVLADQVEWLRSTRHFAKAKELARLIMPEDPNE